MPSSLLRIRGQMPGGWYLTSSPVITANLSATWYTGGRTIVDGIRNDDLQENSRFGFAVARPLSRKDSIRLYGSIGVATRTGSDFDTVGIAWQRHWGGS